MISDKKLYELMIKHHSTFVGWFIHKGLVEKKDEGLFLIEAGHEEGEKRSLPTEDQYKVYETYYDGVKRINGETYDKNFCQIHLNNKVKGCSFKPLVDAGFPIFDLRNTSDRYCFTHQVEDIINHFPDLVLDFYLPKDYKRLKGESKDNYLRLIENQIKFIRSNDNMFRGYYCFNYNFIGKQIGFSDHAPEKIENIEKHGIFANENIYKYVEWDFEMVEKYKDQIIWQRLINDSNLIWTEDMLIKYDSYIPYCTNDNDTYCGKFSIELDYTKFGPLSNKFIEDHKDVLDWMDFFEDCQFQWNGKEMTHFCMFALGLDMPYSDSFRDTTASSQIEYSLTKLLSNKYFTWTADNLLAYLLASKQNWKSLVGDFRPQLFSIFLSIPNIRIIAEPHVKGIDNFWETVSNLHPYPYDELTPEFTIDRIKNNIEEWSKVLENKFLTMRRTPDTNYHYYWVKTQWDVYSNRKNIPLTYDLAKYLSGIEIKLGGTYMESDGGYMEEDHRFPIYNGLAAFSSHHIDTEKDMEEMLKDEEITDIVFGISNSTNIDLLYYAIELFFQDYSLREYIGIVNRLKDWDVVKEYYSDSDNLHGEDSEYLKSCMRNNRANVIQTAN